MAKLPKVDAWVVLGQAWVRKARETADPVYYLNADACATEALKLDPDSEQAARRLVSRPRLATLSPAQAETLAIVAYLQPISRPEITRIRGVSADSAAATLLERGLIEEAGSSQFGAVLYRSTNQFLKLFGLASLDDLPDVARWDPTPAGRPRLARWTR